MRVHATREIRNVAVVGHGASGKTSLVDALAFVAGSSKRHGSVKDGSALTDYTPDEIERKYSINLRAMQILHRLVEHLRDGHDHDDTADRQMEEAGA